MIYIFSIFLSAFLLFQIQPMIAKYILPWFGGTPAVWSTVMLFFQVLLTGGYAYGHYLIDRIPPARQWKVHAALLSASVVLMAFLAFLWASPITPSAGWKPQNVDTPILDIFILLSISVGLPYFMLSTNSPLMQSWFGRMLPGRSPYRLYALSNLGSLIALVSYPVLIEPLLGLRWQGWIWSVLYAGFALLAGYAAFYSRNAPPGVAHPASEPAPVSVHRPSAGRQILWISLSATASLLLLAVTNQITQEVAPIPFLWILPLTLYLLSFIFAFENERWYNRPIFALLFLFATAGFIYLLLNPLTHYLIQIGIFSLLAFTGFMISHGELYKIRPEPAHLTRFYLMVSVGGALGGVFVNFVAPAIFKGYWEFNIGMLLVWLLLMIVTLVRPTRFVASRRVNFAIDAAIGAVAVTVLIFTLSYISSAFSDARYAARNFYGVVRVKAAESDDGWEGYNLSHGITMHGLQFSDPEKRKLTTAYYTENGGAGLAILNHPRYGQGMRVGVLGLGIGTLAAYGLPGDEYRLYEINPVIIELARGEGGFFHYLEDSQAEIEVVEGDARISLERELATGGWNFDVLVLDTFSSDSIPVHLVTREAFELYLSHLSADGILAVHISNQHLDLLPVLWQLKENFGLALVTVETSGEAPRQFPSQWVLMARNPALFQNPAIASAADPLDGYIADVSLWTDEYSNLFQILK